MPAKKGSRGRDPEILVYLHRFCEGGVERVALRLADSWSRSGARVTIAVAYATPPVSSVPAGNWVVRQSGMTWWPRSLEGLWMAAWLIRCVRRGSPDVIFCPGNSYTISAVLAKAWLGRKCPPILCKISNSLVRRDFTGVVRKAYDAWLRLQGRTIDCFAATAEPVAFEAERALAIDPARIAVLPNPVIDRALVERLDAAAQDHSPRNAWTFLSVGRLVPQKNY
ncbi:MAG: glycosyltransferase, partial [Novosphingobium sp.]|nr:glycosyltransferase [Novosphingobium sp.]